MRRLTFVIIMMAVISARVAAALPGSGTQEDPWRIESSVDFLEFAGHAGYRAGYIRLETDVNLGRGTFTSAVIAEFTGVFDGNGHKITGLTIDDGGAGNDYLGLFGRIDNGEIKNLRIEGGSVKGRDCVGGLVGESGVLDIPGGTITNCYFSGEVIGTGAGVGGIVGYSWGSVSGCYFSGNVDGVEEVGGLVGRNMVGSVSNCYSTGDVNGDDYVGGLAGNNHIGSISNSYFCGDVGGDGNVGGLMGKNNYACVSNCFWDTEVQSHGVTDSIGLNDGGTVTNVAGLLTAQMHTKSTFTSAGWDFVAEFANGTSETWQMPVDGGYPVLSFFHSNIPAPLSGSGTAADPYLIGDVNELGMVNWYPVHCCFKLTGDIDLSGVHWSVAVIPVFNGCFDGAGYKLTNMEISGGGHLGLFGYLGENGRVNNVALEGNSVSGTGYYVGGLVGKQNYGSISSCYSTGDVSGFCRVGGLVGKNHNGSISSCYSIGDVSGEYYVGGLAGVNYGSISSCYSTGDVSGFNGVGGLVGENAGGTISTCYSIGDVNGVEQVGGLAGENRNSFSALYYWGVISNCFWDAEAQSHGVTYSIGENDATVTNVSGLPTAEMQVERTFTSAAWDFVEIWNIGENQTYPYLRTVPAGDINKDRIVNFLDLCIVAEQWCDEH